MRFEIYKFFVEGNNSSGRVSEGSLLQKSFLSHSTVQVHPLWLLINLEAIIRYGLLVFLIFLLF